MAAPTVPPRPPQYSYEPQQNHNNPPPVPPLPPDFRYEESPPHFADPLVAPRPHKLTPDLPADMARTLDDAADPFRRSPPAVNYNPGGFAMPQPQIQPQRGASPLPPPQGSHWGQAGPWSPPPQQPIQQQNAYQQLTPAMAALSFNAPQPPPAHARAQSTYGPPPKAPSPPRGVPALTAPLPTIPTLSASLASIQQGGDPAVRIAWCRDVFFLVERTSPQSDTPGPVRISDPQLSRLAQVAVPIVLQIASSQGPMQISTAEAIYHRATLAASGAYPDQVRHNPRAAFRDFEQAARAGYAAAWFRLGRDYENFNDVTHARDCFERGVKLNVESCTYRMGMAHLMGQLGLPVNPDAAVPLLHRAATLASLDVPQPAYVYGLLLLSEFAHVSVPPHLFPPSPQRESEARRHLERAAFLGFAPAQYKLGHAYEFAQPPFPFDPLLSVQYYSLASQQGETEADMALSKWFLCGAEGSFEKDEALAYTFAEKAARKGLPSAEFAMGYYAEVGVGGPKDLDTARKWYTRAADHGNTDAVDRLGALSQPAPQALSRQEHDTLTKSKLVRKRTQAQQRSDSTSGGAASGARQRRGDGRQIVDVIRRDSVARPQQSHANTMPAAHQQQQHPPLQQIPSASTMPSASPAPSSSINTTGSPQLRPQAAGGRQFPEKQRYTLVDSGASTGPRSESPGRGPSPVPPMRRTASGPVAQGQGQEQPAPQRPPPKGPATFAEMGFQGAKAEDKDCVIM